MKKICLLILLCFIITALNAQNVLTQRNGNELSFFLSLNPSDDIAIVDSMAISTSAKQVICDLRGKSVFLKMDDENCLDVFIPWHECFSQLPNNRELSYYHIGTIVDPNQYVDLPVVGRIGTDSYQTQPLEAINQPNTEILNRVKTSYRYGKYFLAKKTFLERRYRFSEGEFDFSFKQTSKSVIPYELFLTALLVMLAIFFTRKFQMEHRWEIYCQKWGVGREPEKKSIKTPIELYSWPLVITTFLFFFVLYLPLLNLWYNFDLYGMVGLILFTLVPSTALTAIFIPFYLIHRHVGLAIMALSYTALLGWNYGLSWVLVIPILGWLAALSLERLNQKNERETEERMKQKISLAYARRSAKKQKH